MFWQALNKIGYSDYIEWISGKALTYTDWGAGEPAAFATENCVGIEYISAALGLAKSAYDLILFCSTEKVIGWMLTACLPITTFVKRHNQLTFAKVDQKLNKKISIKKNSADYPIYVVSSDKVCCVDLT
jgi:hypothetical protein